MRIHIFEKYIFRFENTMKLRRRVPERDTKINCHKKTLSRSERKFVPLNVLSASPHPTCNKGSSCSFKLSFSLQIALFFSLKKIACHQ